MLIGAMNHPSNSICSEIARLARLGFDLIDLTLEPPEAAYWTVDVPAVREMLHAHKLDVVGHTAYYLPIASPFETLRKAAVGELLRCAEVFSRIGVEWMNVHPDTHCPMHTRAFLVEQNVRSLQELVEGAAPYGVRIMIENVPRGFNTPEELSSLLDPIPSLGLHLDIGHANLLTQVNTTPHILEHLGSRLAHVHLHDNRGGLDDLHLPLGAGTMPWVDLLTRLKAFGYDGGITLEVFTKDQRYLGMSRERLIEAWARV